MQFETIRVLRTPHSERFVFQQSGRDFAALELHYLANSMVAGTLVVFDGCGVDEKDVPELLKQIDETLLPEVSIEEENLSFTVVFGRVVGSFVPASESNPSG